MYCEVCQRWDQKALVRDEIKKRWREYFDKLFNRSSTQDLDDLTIQCQDMNRNYMRRISESEVKEALKRMKSRKAVDPDETPIEVWRCLWKVGVRWLTNLFNKIWLTKKMPNEWRKSTLVHLYKNKGDIQSCSNYREIKLTCHTMKLWERVIEHRLRQNVNISENQFGFILGQSTTEAIHLLRQLIKRFRERKRNLHMVFIDLEKANDKVLREVLWWTLMKKSPHQIYWHNYGHVRWSNGKCQNLRRHNKDFLSQLDCINDMHGVHSYMS